MAANQNRKPDGDWSWTLIILAFIFIWPVGLVLLFGKLFADDGKKPAQQAPPLQYGSVWSADPVSSRSRGKAAKAVKKVTKSPVAKKSNAWLLKLAGVLLLAFGLHGAAGIVDLLIWTGFENLTLWLSELLRACALSAAGLGMLVKGVSIDRQLKRFSKYLLVMGDRGAVSVEDLARTLGYSERRVEKDLEKMIDRGYFGGQAYLNMELGYLFRANGAEAQFRQRYEEAQQQAAPREAPPPPPKETEEGYSGILRNIRRANDEIADPVLSAKIDRLEDITAKIFRAVEEDPKKKERIGTFLNYYLPTTQKLLDSYAEFEAAGVEGDNLRQAKQRIEATMDSIVKGFEHQLDELYKADAMDVDSDIRVMEHMLRRDTGSAEQDFGLGGSAVQTSPEDD